MKKQWLWEILLLVLWIVSSTHAAPPNIVYILADDMGYGDAGCYGQKVLKTPHIDRLAREGMRFTQHYAGCTVCAPSRSSLMEGLHTGHTSVRGNQPNHLLDPNNTTLAEALRTAGYHTGIVGKWGLGHLPPPHDPKLHGFDFAYGYVNMWHAHNFYPEFLYRNGEKVVLPGNVLDRTITFKKQPEGCGVARDRVVYAPYEIEREALAYIERHQKQPFFLFVSLNQPHNNGELARVTRNGCEVPHYGKFTTKKWPDDEKGYAELIRMIDDTVGKVVNKLETLGLTQNTAVIFSSDNGGFQGGGHKVNFFKSCGPLRGYKRDLYEGGIRVPFIVKWPACVAPNTTSDHICAMWDLLPTFCDMAGVPAPANLDGISLLPTLKDSGLQKQHDYLYWEFREQGGKQAVREGRWKAVKLHTADNKPEVFELYDLEKDHGEAKNLADKHPEIVKRMKRLIHEAHVPHPVVKLFPHE